jgi:hypothetical protein
VNVNQFRQPRRFPPSFELCHGARTKPIIDLSFELKDLGLARQRLEAGKQFGKIIFRIYGLT